MFTTQEFIKLYPNCVEPVGWVQEMNDLFPQYEIDTPQRIALFIAQCGHESGGWRIFEENLNYSAKALNRVFRKYFKDGGRNAEEYHRCPEKIANIVYANRMGNGDIKSGDGWKYRGRGPIQLTGHNNYSDFSTFINIDVLFNPNLITKSKKISLLSAIWYWDKHNLNHYADNLDIKGATKRINGGYNGLEDRIHHFNKAYTILTQKPNYSPFGIIDKNLRSRGL